MTANTPRDTQAFQETCLARHLPAVPHPNFQLPKPQARFPYLPNARSITPRGRIDVMFDPVITTEAHLAFSSARTHSNNNAEMKAMIGACGSVARDVDSFL